MIKKIFAFGLAAVLALTPVQAFGKIVSITNVSYDPTREMFEQYNKIFEKHWKGKPEKMWKLHSLTAVPENRHWR